MSTSKKVVVVGAGIGGLTAALALLKRGIDVEVYEQSDQLREIGAGIQISSNGTRVLFALGLETALANVQVRPERRELRHWSTGETWNWFDLGDKSIERFGTPHLMLHRADLHGGEKGQNADQRHASLKVEQRAQGEDAHSGAAPDGGGGGGAEHVVLLGVFQLVGDDQSDFLG